MLSYAQPSTCNRRHFLPGMFFLLFVLACGEARIERMIQKADNEWIKGRNHSAVEILKSVLEERPSGPLAEEALFRLGEIHYFSISDTAKALEYFKDLAQLSKKDKFAYQAQKYIAEIIEFSAKDYDQAIIEYQKLINNFGYAEDNPGYQYRISSVYYKKQDYDQALIEFETVLEKYPQSSLAEESYYKAVNILYSLGRCPEVRQRYAGFMEKYPKSKYLGEVEFVMASCMEEEGNLKEAAKKFQALEEIYPYPALLSMKLEGIKNRLEKKQNPKNDKMESPPNASSSEKFKPRKLHGNLKQRVLS